MKKIAFVAPWFGMNIQGGAEAETREVALHLASAGVDVEILTTCIQAFNSNWNVNHFKEGMYSEGGLTVRRFKADKRDAKAFDAVNIRLMNNRPITIEQEGIFLRNMVNSTNLYHFIEENSDEYTAFVFIPYMFGTTFYGCQICPEKSVLIPCFHDESYFYMKNFKKVFSKVAGIVYNAAPEKTLTEKNYPLGERVKQIVMGIGMNTDQTGNAERFRDKYKIKDPFILYAGRKDKGKNVDTLLKYFAEYKHRNPEAENLRVVMIGGGQIDVPASIKSDVIDLGFVDIQDKYDAYSAADVLCQPSQHESFSFVIMESWLAGRPVLVADQCAVTQNFCRESNGGLWFRDFFEFEAALNYITKNRDISLEMGRNGRDYVIKHFDWSVIVGKYIQFFESIN